METITIFTMRITNNHVSIHEDESAKTIEFRAKDILNNGWLGEMIAESLCNRFREIIEYHIEKQK